MKEFDLSQLFCEVVSGLAVLVVTMVLADWLGVMPLPDQMRWAWANLSPSRIGVLLLVAYIVGLGLDAAGLAADWVFEDTLRLIGTRRPTPDSTAYAGFYGHVTEHVFSYWKEQWTYYSLYRNLALCTLIGAVPATCVASSYVSACWTGALAIGFAFTLACLWYAMRTLLNLYRAIILHVARGSAGSAPGPTPPTVAPVGKAVC